MSDEQVLAVIAAIFMSRHITQQQSKFLTFFLIGAGLLSKFLEAS